MEIITQAEIDGTQEKFKTFTENDVRKLMKLYQRKQTALLVYTAAVAEREELNDDEYDVFISATLLIWQCIKDKFPNLKKVRIERLDELDNRMVNDLESMLDKPDSVDEDFLQHLLQTHAQPNLLQSLHLMTMHGDDSVRPDVKGILFLAARNVLDALIEAC